MYLDRSDWMSSIHFSSLAAFELCLRNLGRICIAFFCLLPCTMRPAPPPARTSTTERPTQVKMPIPPPIRYISGLEEALVATGPVTSEETKDLDDALAAFHA